MNQCRLCGIITTDLDKSHIIPEAFFRELRSDGSIPLVVGDLFPKRAQIGVYDESILCRSCKRQ